MTDLPNNYVILPHWNKPQFLMLTGDTGWTLPRHHETDAPDIIQAIQDRFGLSVTVLGEAYGNFKGRQSETESLIYRTAFELAQRLAILCRCLTWHYIVTHIEERRRGEFEDVTPYWLRLFLHNGEEFE